MIGDWLLVIGDWRLAIGDWRDTFPRAKKRPEPVGAFFEARRLSVSLAGLVEVLEAEVGRVDVAFGATAVETLALELVGHDLSLIHI